MVNKPNRLEGNPVALAICRTVFQAKKIKPYSVRALSIYTGIDRETLARFMRGDIPSTKVLAILLDKQVISKKDVIGLLNDYAQIL